LSDAPLKRVGNLTTVLDRQTRMLRTAMGPAIAAALEDPEIVEVLLNPDGTLWFDRLGSGRAPSGLKFTAHDAERIIRLVAAHVRIEVHPAAPIVSAELPATGERFEGVLPPVTRAPVFAIRKRAVGVISLAQYVIDGILTEEQALSLRQAVRDRRNIVIAGGTSSGKTTLANALLQEMAATGDRVILLEDTVELQCMADDHVPMRTKPGVASMSELVRSTLRLRPDRIVIGEVRGKGLMIGIEFVRDQKTKEKANDLRNKLVQMAFHKGLLVLGSGDTTLRLCPPLLIDEAQADFALDTLEACITELERSL